MIDVDREPSPRRGVSLTMAAATFGGIVFGAAVARLAAYQSVQRVSFYLWLDPAYMGGASGYLWWLTSDRARAERFWRIVFLGALVVIAAIVLRFPESSWKLVQGGRGTIPGSSDESRS